MKQTIHYILAQFCGEAGLRGMGMVCLAKKPAQTHRHLRHEYQESAG
jgi:hypothetical protein